ncbi:protein TAB2 homolog, chloroplastic [Selaginella moellendorffii]|nr:protein TAB2 homolog, chloroplastic [Selaginella moellendorffii]|eukprot:XP_002977207.2 protein TAB2 homolog, chloroplastic [Selaginella moellendorffii]
MAMALFVPCGFLTTSRVSWRTPQPSKGAQLHTGLGRLKNSRTVWKCAVEGSSSVVSEDLASSISSLDEEKGNEEKGNEEGEGAQVDGRVLEGADLASIVEWQLDFCSRPIFDDRGKRMWELIICDAKRQLEFARFYPSNVINSTTLKNAIAEVIETFDLPRPTRVRYFRSQVKTIISKACGELGIQVTSSQRCTALVRWLHERYDQVYRQHPGFQENAPSILSMGVNVPKEVPPNYRGEKWAFVQLSFQALQEEIKLVEKGSNFGEVSLDMLTELPSPDTLIPGVAVASSRDLALAAWTNSLELASLSVDKKNSALVLLSGASRQWFYSYYKKSKQADEEADLWESAKKAAGGLHFLAIQPSLESNSCSGLWILYDFPAPPV